MKNIIKLEWKLFHQWCKKHNFKPGDGKVLTAYAKIFYKKEVS